MKANYTITSAKSMITRNKGKFEGKMILIDFPGIKVLGAIDFLKSKGYAWKKPIYKPKRKSFVQRLVEFRNKLIDDLTIKSGG